MTNRFDELAKELASGVSRREALRRGVGALAGMLLASVGLGKAWADGKPTQGNAACAAFCTRVFPPGPQRGQCISDAAHGVGLCVDCGANPSHFCGGQPFCCAGETPLCFQGACYASCAAMEEICKNYCDTAIQGGKRIDDCLDDCVDFRQACDAANP